MYLVLLSDMIEQLGRHAVQIRDNFMFVIFHQPGCFLLYIHRVDITFCTQLTIVSIIVRAVINASKTSCVKKNQKMLKRFKLITLSN